MFDGREPFADSLPLFPRSEPMADRSVSAWVLLVLGIGGILNGFVMLFASEPWFPNVAADTGPFNAHLVRDVGAAYVTSGVASVWAARAPQLRAVLAGMAALFLGLSTGA